MGKMMLATMGTLVALIGLSTGAAAEEGPGDVTCAVETTGCFCADAPGQGCRSRAGNDCHLTAGTAPNDQTGIICAPL